VEKQLPYCEHTALMPCSQDSAAYRCVARCGITMNCCHKTCKSQCYECQGGDPGVEIKGPIPRLLHRAHPCEQRLYCEHHCQEACSEDHHHTTKCMATCRQSCAHAQCRSPCSTPCAPCQEPCTWCVYSRYRICAIAKFAECYVQELPTLHLPRSLRLC
jgi:hypothetical protein